MEGFWDIPKENAMKAYAQVSSPTVTDQLLYAILAQLDKMNHQLERLADKDEE
jgi:hypothetical protein